MEVSKQGNVWVVEILTEDQNYQVRGKTKEQALEKAVKSLELELNEAERTIRKIRNVIGQ